MGRVTPAKPEIEERGSPDQGGGVSLKSVKMYKYMFENLFVPEGNILIRRAAACWPLDFGSRGCAAKCKVIGALSHNPSKGPKRVS